MLFRPVLAGDHLVPRPQHVSLLLAAGGTIVAASTIYSVISTLNSLNQSLIGRISLADPMKMFVSLSLFLGLAALSMALASSRLASKGRPRTSTITCGAGILLAAATFATPSFYGVPLQESHILTTAVGILLMVIGTGLASRIPQKEEPRRPFLGSIEVASVATLSAVYAIVIILTGQSFPSPTGGYLHFGDFVVFVAALTFGYKVGGLVGILGAIVADFYLGYPRWYVTILAHGLEGVIPGFARGRSLALQVVAAAVGGFLMASTYFFVNIFLKGYPVAIISYAQDLFGQAAISVAVGIPMVAIVRRVLPRVR
jgi:uncharacterized membrane protein